VVSFPPVSFLPFSNRHFPLCVFIQFPLSPFFQVCPTPLLVRKPLSPFFFMWLFSHPWHQLPSLRKQKTFFPLFLGGAPPFRYENIWSQNLIGLFLVLKCLHGSSVFFAINKAPLFSLVYGVLLCMHSFRKREGPPPPKFFFFFFFLRSFPIVKRSSFKIVGYFFFPSPSPPGILLSWRAPLKRKIALSPFPMFSCHWEGDWSPRLLGYIRVPLFR